MYPTTKEEYILLSNSAKPGTVIKTNQSPDMQMTQYAQYQPMVPYARPGFVLPTSVTQPTSEHVPQSQYQHISTIGHPPLTSGSLPIRTHAQPSKSAITAPYRHQSLSGLYKPPDVEEPSLLARQPDDVPPPQLPLENTEQPLVVFPQPFQPQHGTYSFN